ncbi:protein stand still [Drosophila busckii]|uniref:protein stand still n=1 Tax=Drosophila busckii TaxID=30019 RepID=UPI00083F04AB|nr:protein stand still [Drosophila busckii]
MPKVNPRTDMDEQPDSSQDQTNSVNVKSELLQRQHVPYILNGELYRIVSQIGDNVTVKCCYCPPDRIYRGSVRSTGNFHMHIKRRHASLLGKLHEMKVAALVERRDRIMKNRRFAKNSKRSSSSSPCFVDTPTHELKIKTVFQRHKQEHNEQEEAAAVRTPDSISASPPLTTMNNNEIKINHNNNVLNLSPVGRNVTNPSPVSEPEPDLTFVNNQSVTESLTLPIEIPRLLPFGLIKPEQHQQMLLEQEQPQAIDLSKTSSLQDEDHEGNALSRSARDAQIQVSVSHNQMLAPYVNGVAPREVLIRIDNTLGDIKDELQTRNQIERKRLLFDIAKFQFLHPNFNFDNAQ